LNRQFGKCLELFAEVFDVADGERLPEHFQSLCDRAAVCRKCTDLAEKTAVLSRLNGSLKPKVFFIAEAPGRLGADRTRRPFFGDRSGENFQRLLDSIGLERNEVYITNSVMCSPRSAADTNRRPTKVEIRNCGELLSEQIDLLQPKLIAAVGSVALTALKSICDHKFTLREHAGQSLQWNGRTLVPLYHPSPQVVAFQRGLDLQLQHFRTLTLIEHADGAPTESVDLVDVS
jgi:uracil-DNA glycosylase